MPHLTADVYSHLRPHVKYGSKGEEVKLIQSYENVLIVENNLGDRFPVHPEKVTFESNGQDHEQEGAEPANLSGVVQRKTSAIRRAKKNDALPGGSIPGQNSLF